MIATILTLTGDRPEAFALCERWIGPQVGISDTWRVVDNGDTPAKCTQHQRVIQHVPVEDRRVTFLASLHDGLRMALHGKTDLIIFCEDDDYYPYRYIETIKAHAARYEIIGVRDVPYYHVQHRVYREVATPSRAALAFTAISRPVASELLVHLNQLLAANVTDVFVDQWIWNQSTHYRAAVLDLPGCVAIKGMPGRPGLGMWHSRQWDAMSDPDGAWLRKRIGVDAELYMPFGVVR